MFELIHGETLLVTVAEGTFFTSAGVWPNSNTASSIPFIFSKYMVPYLHK